MKAARRRAAWSLEALAFHSGLSWSAVSQLESGRRKNPRPETLAALAKALGVTADYLIGGESRQTMLSHAALVYRDDRGFADAAGPFLAKGVERSEAVLAVTSEANIQLLREGLGPAAEQVEFLPSESWYETPAAALKAYRRFIKERTEGGASWARVVGEPIWTGRTAAETRVWTQYESMLNLTLAMLPATILCVYDERTAGPAILTSARLTHPQMVEEGESVDNSSYQDPAIFVLGPEET